MANVRYLLRMSRKRSRCSTLQALNWKHTSSTKSSRRSARYDSSISITCKLSNSNMDLFVIGFRKRRHKKSILQSQEIRDGELGKPVFYLCSYVSCSHSFYHFAHDDLSYLKLASRYTEDETRHCIQKTNQLNLMGWQKLKCKTLVCKRES